MVTTSKDCDSSDTDGTERINDSFHKQNHAISNLEYAKLKYQILQTSLYCTNSSSSSYWSYMFMHVLTSIHENFRQS